MTHQPRELRTAKLEFQVIAAMALPLFFLLVTLLGNKNSPPSWFFVSTAGFYLIALFLGTAEITRMGKTPRALLRVISSIKMITLGLSITVVVVYTLTRLNHLPHP